MVRRLPAEFVRLLERQHGVFSVSQAMSHGLTEDQVRAHVDGRRWRPSARGVYVGFTGPLHERHLEWTAVLLGGDHAMLSHDTAAHHHGLVPERPTAVHVLVPHDETPQRRHGVVFHRTRSTRVTAGSPPVVSVADTLCDLSAFGWPPRKIAGLVASAVQRRLTSPRLLADALLRRGPFPGVAAMRALVEDTSAGAESALELRFLREVERAHGLPPGVRQSVVRRADRRVAVRDVHYPDFAVTVELDGKAHHASLEARLRDQRRDRLAADQGELTLRYAWLDATVDACLSARELGGTLRARGWTGQFHTCPSCERLPVP